MKSLLEQAAGRGIISLLNVDQPHLGQHHHFITRMMFPVQDPAGFVRVAGSGLQLRPVEQKFGVG